MKQIRACLQGGTEDEETRQYAALQAYAAQQGLVITSVVRLPLEKGSGSAVCPLEGLQAGDTLLLTELRCLGRSTLEVLERLHKILSRRVRLMILELALELDDTQPETQMLALWCKRLATLERDFVQRRTKLGLTARRAQGMPLGKPKGTLQASKFDPDRPQIETLLGRGISGRKIAEILGYPNAIGLNKYIRRRGLRSPESDDL